MYQVGDRILYPMHGAGIIKKIEKREILGSVKDYYILHVPCGDMKVMIPVDNCDAIGVRPIVSEEEIAAAIGEKRESVARAMDAIVEPISLYDPVYSESGDSIYVMDQISDTSDGDKQWLENIALRDAMRRLSDREQRIIQMRFYQNKTQMEIASEIGISQAQVSRLEKGALERIRREI